MSAMEPLAEQLSLFPESAWLIKIVPEKNQHRFYTMTVAPTLFGEWSLVREWGRIGRRGRVRIDIHRTEGEALDSLGALLRRKRDRGYWPSAV